MVTLENNDARIVHRILYDIVNIQQRSECSDATFRKHFMLLVSGNPYLPDILKTLENQIGDR